MGQASDLVLSSEYGDLGFGYSIRLIGLDRICLDGMEDLFQASPGNLTWYCGSGQGYISFGSPGSGTAPCVTSCLFTLCWLFLRAWILIEAWDAVKEGKLKIGGLGLSQGLMKSLVMTIGVFSLLFTAGWAFAFSRIYTDPHPRVAATQVDL